VAGSNAASAPAVVDRRAPPAANASPGSTARSSDSGTDAKDKVAAGVSNSSGAATGGGNAFPGISIVGGNTDGAAGPGNATPNNTNTNKTNTAPPRSYGIVIATTGSTGAGLRSSGVFSNEQVYTAYLDMKWPNGKPAPSWTFEYAVLQKAPAPVAPPTNPTQGNEVRLPARNQQGFVLPFPIIDEQPALPVELVQKYLRRLVVVYAILNADGKMEQMTVKETPDAQLNGPVLSALSKWTFKPAQFNGDNVSVKVLLGFPLSLPE
jgi:hypothetical protein